MYPENENWIHDIRTTHNSNIVQHTRRENPLKALLPRIRNTISGKEKTPIPAEEAGTSHII
jgi:hypothetical protein